MIDAVRIGLFGLSLGALIASSIGLVSGLRLGGAGSVLALWVVGAGQVVLLAEGLSLLRALDWPGFLLGHLLIAAGVAAWARRRPPAERWRAADEIRAGWRRLAPMLRDWRMPALPLLAGATLLVGLLSAALALWVPPNSVDSLSYHMSRVGYYLQFRSLGHYPTDDPRQVAFPANAEILILWTVAFLRSDVLANLVQFAAWAITAVAVYGLGRQVGLGARAALFGAGLFALLPQAVLQSTSTLNDLVVASFVAAALVFLFRAAQVARPTACLTLAGAAAGLAVGTKGTALLALPGLAAVGLLLLTWSPGGCYRRLAERPVASGLLLGGVAAALLGAHIYGQNWLLYGTPTGPAPLILAGQVPVMPWPGFVANLARTLYQFAFADLSGPLADPLAGPVTGPLVQGLAAVGERVFAVLGIPTVVQGIDLLSWRFSFVVAPRTSELSSGVGPIGGLAMACAAATVAWPRVPPRRRLLAMVTLSYLLLLALTLRWSPVAGGRFLLTACAVGAPLLGLVVQRPGAWREALALALAVWSGAIGLYVAGFNENKPVPRLAGEDRLGLITLSPYVLGLRVLFREVDLELGPNGTVGVYGDPDPVGGRKSQWEYQFFGARFARTVLPLVGPRNAEQMGLRRPPPWTNEDLLSAYRPTYIAVERRSGAADTRPDILPGRCFELPLRHGRPAVRWELWRCEDRDPRSLVGNGDFAAWSGGPGPFVVEEGSPPIETADGWEAEAAGAGRLAVSRLEPAAGGEPFRVRLEYRAARRGRRETGISQELPLADLRGRVLVVDARVRADRAGAAVAWIDDGISRVELTNETTEPETLRVERRVDEQAGGLWVGLDASGAGRDAVVEVRTILAIPREDPGG